MAEEIKKPIEDGTAAETEAIKAVKDELTAQMNELKKTYETQLATMRTEHANQLRDILKNGNNNTAEPDTPDSDDDVDDDGIDQKKVKAEIAKLNKKLRMW